MFAIVSFMPGLCAVRVLALHTYSNPHYHRFILSLMDRVTYNLIEIAADMVLRQQFNGDKGTF